MSVEIQNESDLRHWLLRGESSEAVYMRGPALPVAAEKNPERKAFFDFLLRRAEGGSIALVQRRIMNGDGQAEYEYLIQRVNKKSGEFAVEMARTAAKQEMAR